MWSSDFRYNLAHNYSVWQTFCHPHVPRNKPASPLLSTVQGDPKKWTANAVHITSSNIGRFSTFFHCYNLQEICDSVVINYSTTPQTRHYTALWNIYVRKLACPVWCGSFAWRRTFQNPDVWLAAAAILNKIYWLGLLLLFCISVWYCLHRVAQKINPLLEYKKSY